MKVKKKLSQKNLEKLDLVYVRLFEYACEVWDNCGVGNYNKLDHLRLEAARIIGRKQKKEKITNVL